MKTAAEANLATKFGKSTIGSPIFSGYSFGNSSLQQIQRGSRLGNPSGFPSVLFLLFGLRSLPLLVPNPPALPPYVPGGDHTGEVKILRQYLQDHQETLQKIEPIGDGLVPSKQVCLQILKADPAIPNRLRKPKSGR